MKPVEAIGEAEAFAKGALLTRAYIATRMPNLLVMPASRRTAGPRTAFPAGSGHDAVRLKPAFTAGFT